MRTNLMTLVAALIVAVSTAPEAGAIPPLARKYKTSCQTCHVIIPKLNSFGEAVRLNGYKIPEGEEALVKDEPLQLGAEFWKEMWPRAIWPSALPGMPPIGLRIVNDVQFTREQGKDYSSNFEFPHEVELLAGGRFSEKVGFFGEVEWEQGGGAEVKQAYLIANGLLSPFLEAPDELLNMRVGLFDTQLLLAHNNTTRAGTSNPLWGNKRLSDATIGGFISLNEFRLQNNQPGIELNGIVARRLYWAVGIVNGAGEVAEDDNNHKDPYYKVKWKLIGRDFLGKTSEPQTGETTDARSWWSDRELLLEQFGYFGQGVVKGGLRDGFRYFGGAIRGTCREVDLSLGHVWGNHDRPFGTDSQADVRVKSWFAKAECLVFPWLMARIVYEDLDFKAGQPLNTGSSTQDQKRLLMGPVLAPLANIRIAIEWEKYLEYDGTAPGANKPDNLWIRFDWAF